MTDKCYTLSTYKEFIEPKNFPGDKGHDIDVATVPEAIVDEHSGTIDVLPSADLDATTNVIASSMSPSQSSPIENLQSPTVGVLTTTPATSPLTTSPIGSSLGESTGTDLCADFSGYECPPTTSQSSPENTHHMVTRTKSKAMSQPPDFLTLLVAANSNSSEPRNLQEALSQPHWLQAMQEEMQALYQNNTWRLVQ
ncbi:hypothetical protein KY290_036823 [Solanum tuberosum]|uniref:Integrase core domain containing protein n=1 Tax=Solanum tuberosum TaxID=4113 RepID=A0ABQ7TUL5_SOLTU|nr:hypothetical protein KY285_036145 [Solanum tuberosum]KAH0738118.1 hypothetical protein KY290_036823 [Solanum tuberosum]